MAVHCEVPPGLSGGTELAGDGVAHQEARHCHRHQVHRHPPNHPHLSALTWQLPLLSGSPGSLSSTFTGGHLSLRSKAAVSEDKGRNEGPAGSPPSKPLTP